MKWRLVSSPMKQLKGHKGMGSNCTGKGLNSILEKKCFRERVAKHWSRLPREVGALLSLEVFNMCYF